MRSTASLIQLADLEGVTAYVYSEAGRVRDEVITTGSTVVSGLAA